MTLKSHSEIRLNLNCYAEDQYENCEAPPRMYLNNWPKAEEAIGAFRKALLDGRITVSLREQLQKEADETELLISKGEEAVNAFCSQTISNARRLFICSTTP